MRTLLLTAIAVNGFAAAGLPADMQTASRGLRDLARACALDGGRLWRKSLCGPVVLVNRSTRFAIANRPDPDGKFRAEEDVYFGAFPDQFTPSNTAIQWKGEQWATVMLPLPEDRFQRIALLVHESFHRIQPGLGLSAPDAPNAHLDTGAGRIWLRLELRALARALRQNGMQSRRSAADAMLFRAYRNRLCPGSEKVEAAMETQEGLAQYTGVAVALRETGEDIGREARAVEAFEDSDSLARSFAYATGPALGLLLDRYATGWRDRVPATSPGAMLASALRIPALPDLQGYVRERAQSYGYSAVAAAELEREAGHKTLVEELTNRFVTGRTLDFPRAAEMRRNFDPGTLVTLPPYGVYYPAGTFAANWGKLIVDSGGALLAPDNLSIRVPAPADTDTRPVKGPGWILELAPGWTIRPSSGAGALVVVPPGEK